MAIRILSSILSIALYAATFAAAYGGRVDPQTWALPAAFTLCLPYLAILTLIAGLGWLASRRFVMAAAAALTLIACAGPISTVIPLKFGSAPHPGEETFSLVTWNMLEASDREHPDLSPSRAYTWLIGCGADILVLQEIGWMNSTESPLVTRAQRDSLKRIYPYHIAGKERMLSIYSKYPVKGARERIPYPSSMALYSLNVNGRPLHILNVHLASYALTPDECTVVSGIRGISSAKKSMKEFKGVIRSKLGDAFRMRALHAERVREIADSVEGNLIICGDFNDVPASWAYNRIMGPDMSDAFAKTHFGPINTYNAHLFLFNIDHVLYRGDLRALSVKRGKIKTSDHYPLIADFAFEKNSNDNDN